MTRAEWFGERMPLARRLLSGAEIVAIGGDILEYTAKDVQKWALIDIQVADDIVYERVERTGNRQFDLEKELGVLRPPFPWIWMEWGLGEMRIGALVTDGRAGDLQHLEDNQLAACIFFADPKHPHIVCSDAVYVVTLDSNGQIDWNQPPAWMLGAGREWRDDKDEASLTQMMVVALYGLTLMNCRNVETAPSGSVKMGRSGRQKRQGVKPVEVRYKTIVLPGGGSTKVGSGSGAHHRATALHKVRGHLKTFTAERPLMGKHVGTYWWGWMVRGSKEHGEVIADYKLGETG